MFSAEAKREGKLHTLLTHVHLVPSGMEVLVREDLDQI
jgi:hypothetical protein